MANNLDFSLAINALEQSPLGVIIVGSDRVIQFANASVANVLRTAPQALVGTSTNDLPTQIREAMQRGTSTVQLTDEGATPQLRVVQCWSQPLAGETRATVLFLWDITEKQKLENDRARLTEELDRLSTRDEITNLPNHRALLAGLEPLISRSRRYENTLSLIRLKIANLNGLDREHGSGSADKALLKTGQTLRDQMRWADLVGRLDSDEFLLILPETSFDATDSLAKKLRGVIADLKIVGSDGNTMQLTYRWGTASWNKGDDAAKLLRRAAQEMESTSEDGAPA